MQNASTQAPFTFVSLLREARWLEMNDTAQNVEKVKFSGTLEANKTEIIYPWTDLNWRPRAEPNHSSPALSPGGLSVSEPDYPWLRENQKPVQRQSEPQPSLQPMNRELLPFGQRIRELRCARGWTQHQAGCALGVSRRTVIRHEKGRSRRPWWSLLETVRRLEEAYAGELDALSRRAR